LYFIGTFWLEMGGTAFRCDPGPGGFAIGTARALTEPIGTGRVLHVRLSVRGPKMIFFECFQLDGSAAPNGFSLTRQFKAIVGLRPVLLGPRTLRRTWGTRPVPNSSVRKRTAAGMWNGSHSRPQRGPNGPRRGSARHIVALSKGTASGDSFSHCSMRSRTTIASIGVAVWGLNSPSFTR
jgi:hypothetical protein